MNQQAFPNPHRTDLTGMTLRDYDVNNVAELAYQFADAMLKERDK